MPQHVGIAHDGLLADRVAVLFRAPQVRMEQEQYDRVSEAVHFEPLRT